MTTSHLPDVDCPADWPETTPDLSGRVILVAGASGGLGAEFARQAAKAGAEVVLLGRRVTALERLYDEIEADGGRAALYPFNLAGANPEEFQQLADTLVSQCGGLHGLVVASAHHPGLGSIANAEPSDWLLGLHVNLSAPFLLARTCLPLLHEQDDAAIVFTINGPDICRRAYWGAYGVAQAGLSQFAAILADELDSTPIRIHGFDPGPMRTSLRQRVWFTEEPTTVPTPERAAQVLTGLASAQGSRFRGQLLRLAGT
ncbi:MAG: SDR family NAD(P)-dependent oxidoreductase [Xanthomonadales bacterium]|nr:SDR family NAD(P)-dependent oxidoreductase [Xanthomonadales bacterium]